MRGEHDNSTLDEKLIRSAYHDIQTCPFWSHETEEDEDSSDDLDDEDLSADNLERVPQRLSFLVECLLEASPDISLCVQRLSPKDTSRSAPLDVLDLDIEAMCRPLDNTPYKRDPRRPDGDTFFGPVSSSEGSPVLSYHGSSRAGSTFSDVFAHSNSHHAFSSGSPGGDRDMSQSTQGQKHPQKRPYHCLAGDNCQYVTERLHDMKRHKASKHDEGHRLIDCPYEDCGRTGMKGFKRKDHLREHSRRWHRRDLPESMGVTGERLG